MEQTAVIGIDLAKSVFQLHGADASGRSVFRKKLTRSQLCAFLERHPPTIVAMEACASAHYWPRDPRHGP